MSQPESNTPTTFECANGHRGITLLTVDGKCNVCGAGWQPASSTPSEPFIKRRTPANKCRYLTGRVDELINNADKLTGRKFSIQALSLLFSLSEALEEFAPILEEAERGS